MMLGGVRFDGRRSESGLCRARRFYGSRPTPLWLVALIAGCAAAPGALIIHACLLIWSPDALPFANLRDLFAQAMLINVALTTLGVVLFRKSKAVEEKASATDADATGVFMRHLPALFRSAKLYALAAEDHYLRVQTDRGDTLIHMSMSDAEALLAKADGLRVHRSHWVARDAIASVSRKRGQSALMLANGQSAPVSRSRLEALAKAGWPVFSD